MPNGDPISALAAKLASTQRALPGLSALGKLLQPHLPPIHLDPVTTPLVRAGTTLGYIITPRLAPGPTAANVALQAGTLWFDPKLLGAQFATVSGWVGIPFATANPSTVGAVNFVGGEVVLDAGATLGLTVTAVVHAALAPAGDPLGRDFASAKLTPFTGASIEFAPEGVSIAPEGKGSATMFGQTTQFAPRPGAAAEPVGLPTPCVAIPTDAVPATFTIGSSLSKELQLSGGAPITGGALSFPIVDADPAAFPEPTDAWGLVAHTGSGLEARFGTLTSPVALAAAVFAILPTRLLGALHTGAQHVTDRYDLWHEPPAAPSPPASQPKLALPPATLTTQLATGSEVAFILTPDEEAAILLGDVKAVLDRPVAADGARIPLDGPGVLARVLSAAGVRIEVAANPEAAGRPLALVAENAIVPVATPQALVILGRLQNARIVGIAELLFPTRGLVPTLPDPYAAHYLTPNPANIQELAVTVKWTQSGGPRVAFRVVQPNQVPSADEHDVAAAETTLEQDLELLALTARGAGKERGRSSAFALLDVSTNADLWGIARLGREASALDFAGLVLEGHSTDTAVFTVPGISWEPVVDGDAPVPQWLTAFSPDDGVPTTFLVSRQEPTPLIPVDALEGYRAQAGAKPTRATFTLPFGITAELEDGPDRAGATGPPTYQIPKVEFPAAKLATARALSIRASGPDTGSRTLPGTARAGFDSGDPAASDYGAVVIGVTPQPNAPPQQAGQSAPLPADFWDQQFFDGQNPCIPVERIDLAGYGTSMFSDWHEQDPTWVGVVRALFNVLLGRTAHELVQFQTWILPWSIRLQRTVVFHRDDGGEVLKHDLGWVAVGDGRFELVQGRVLDGPVDRLTRVRDIVFTGDAVQAPGTGIPNLKTYGRVTFDADVVFKAGLNVKADGREPAPSTPGHGIIGYTIDTVGPAPTPADVIAMMQAIGTKHGSTRLTGTTACIANVGSAGTNRFTVNVSSFGVAVATGALPNLQVAVFGTPRLPKDGQWSIAKRREGTVRPEAVDPHTPIPLTRGTGGAQPPSASGGSYGQNWRLLDPEDAQSVDSPKTYYGLLQGTGTSKTLLEHPLIRDDGQALGFDNKPKLADIGALLGVGGLFPDLGNALEIPSTDDLPMQADGFKRTYDWEIGDPDRTLLDLAVVHLVMVYGAAHDQSDPTNLTTAHGRLVLDAKPGSPNWSLRLCNLSFEARVDGFGTLLVVAGDFQAGSGIKPGFVGLGATDANPRPLSVIYGDALSAIKDIFSGLSDLASSLGGDADLEVGFTGQQLTVKQGFALPTIPLGFGEITDLGIDLGFVATIPKDVAFHVGIGSKDDPFHWLVDPLAGTGAIVLGVDQGALDVYIEAGLGLGLGIDVAIASGSASIVVSLSLAIAADTVTVAVMLTGNAEVDVLGGLASASLTLSAGLSITVHESTHKADLDGEVSVGIHISICWVIDIDFDGSWDFSEEMSI